MAYVRNIEKFNIFRLFRSYTKDTFKNNQLLAYKKGKLGQIEIFYWHEYFEIYYRPYGKLYGYYLNKTGTLKQVYNMIESTYEKQYLR